MKKKYVFAVIIGVLLAFCMAVKLYIDMPGSVSEAEAVVSKSKGADVTNVALEETQQKINYIPQHYRLQDNEISLFKEKGILSYGRPDPTKVTGWLKKYREEQRKKQLLELAESMESPVVVEKAWETFEKKGYTYDEMLDALIKAGKEITSEKEENKE